MAELRAIEPARVAGGLGSNMLESARFAVDDDREIVAYAMVALYAEGTSMAGANCAFPEGSPLNRYLFLQMVQERLREQLITNPVATDIVNRANGFED